jgi:hypothetical protein
MKVIVTDASQRTALYVIRSLGRSGIDITAVEKDVGKNFKEGILSLSDLKPGLVNIIKAIQRLSQG